jgi:Trk K+ transport system NAD-binding subunit
VARYAVIGLSNFGANVARVLFDLGNEVICLDQNESLVKQAHDYSSFGLVWAGHGR